MRFHVDENEKKNHNLKKKKKCKKFEKGKEKSGLEINAG